MFSFMDPKQPFNVQMFHTMASAAIADITARGRLPIVVGGTLYYSQSLLRPSLLVDDCSAVAASRPPARPPPPEELAAAYARLRAVDAISAERLHPHDWRKISRALLAFDATGIPYSQQVFELQRAVEDVGVADDSTPLDVAGGPFDCSVIWLQSPDRSKHDAMLDARVDKMLAGGLVDEIRALKFHLDEVDGRPTAEADTPSAPGPLSQDVPSDLTVRLYEQLRRIELPLPPEAASACASASSRPAAPGVRVAAPPAADAAAPGAVTESVAAAPSAKAEEPASEAAGDMDGSPVGLLQAIGYKEFAEYLAMEAAASSASGVAAGGSSAAAAAALARGLASMKQATRRYARKQDRWIRNRFVLRGTPLLAVDVTAGCTSPAEWAATVVSPALVAVRAWLGDASRRGWGVVLAELSSQAAGRLPAGARAYGPGCTAPESTAVVALPPAGKRPARRGAPPLQSILAASADAAASGGGPVADADAMRVWRKYRCDTCDRTLDGPGEWQVRCGRWYSWLCL